MESSALEFLQRLLAAPSPSGYEQPVQRVVRDYAAEFSDEVRTDVHGNVICGRNLSAPLRVMFAGHCDQIGMLVTYIDDKGFVYAQTIGGWDPQQLIGQRMTIWTAGGEIPAVIARKPIHLLNDTERKQVVKLDELWLDIGAATKEEAAEQVAIGDPVTLQLGYQAMRNGLANSPGMDNKTGLWVVIEGLRRAGSLNCAVYAVSTVQEEIGLRGVRTSAFEIDPHVGVAVDVTHATDCPTVDPKYRGEVALGKGPVIFRGPNMNPVVSRQLIELAAAREIPHQVSAIGRATPNDTNTLQLNRSGVATGLISVPNRYMHSAVETISLDDIDRAADLLAAFVDSLPESADFTPA
ncbi:MAG: M42 family metallopeptidase [Pirellulaceae bacterium]|jgi:endoglucanase|nr:M42 family metallopeptidase [Pirellulaceae bacterium]MDP7018118.1 M42 family metallopeptidase [Pirellulaceae bacterium]